MSMVSSDVLRDSTPRELIQIIGNIVGYTGSIKWDTNKPYGTPRKQLDTSRIQKLGWEPRISLQEGIEKAYRWYISKP